jgi:hypothetical protein
MNMKIFYTPVDQQIFCWSLQPEDFLTVSVVQATQSNANNRVSSLTNKKLYNVMQQK